MLSARTGWPLGSVLEMPSSLFSWYAAAYNEEPLNRALGSVAAPRNVVRPTTKRGVEAQLDAVLGIR